MTLHYILINITSPKKSFNEMSGEHTDRLLGTSDEQEELPGHKHLFGEAERTEGRVGPQLRILVESRKLLVGDLACISSVEDLI